MFKHILIPTDGSKQAAKAAETGVALARQLGARITAYCAIDPVLYPELHGERDPLRVEIERRAHEGAQRHVDTVVRAAQAAGVAAEGMIDRARPHDGIVAAARARGCDVIVIGSHGESGLKSLILGSIAGKVLAHASLPVLVIR